MSSFTVTVPATTANLGPGFDCLGAALSLYNRVTLTQLPDTEPCLSIAVTGPEADKVSRQTDNLIYQSILTFYRHREQSVPSLQLDIELGVPLARGLGSSATAIVAGLVGANALSGFPCSNQELLDLAIALEGHPDNVAPALLGNCQLSVQDGGRWEINAMPWADNLIPVVAIPDFELSTEAARSVLPSTYDRKDVIFNSAHLALLLQALATGRGDWLRVAMEDKIHQPYRQGLIPGYLALKQAALDAGAYNLVISGAGPTLLAITSPETAAPVAQALQQTWQDQGINTQTHILALDRQGANVSPGA
ncbi:homoserine kinase [Synechocystis sp. LKSZ1]|uniref:homoserine kinase n=1 Tax=Synechocystis sp. LKSZ1 TaxID=3144951 RepID=UPI00336BC172